MTARRPYPLVLPPPDGFDQAVRRGRRLRRRRAAGASGSAAVLVAAVFAATSLTNSGPASRLEPVDLVATPEPVQPRPGLGRPPSPLPPPPSAITYLGGTQQDSRGGAVAPAATPSVRRGSPPPGTPYAPKPAMQREDGVLDPCQPLENTESTQQWCDALRYEPNEYDKEHKFTLSICNQRTGGGLNFATLREADVVITEKKTKRTKWTWSLSQRFPAEAHRVSVGPGQCSIWSVSWHETDDFGYEAPVGTYIVEMFSTADEMRNRARRRVEFHTFAAG